MLIENFKEAMSNYPTGVTIMTTYDDSNNPVGMTVNSFAPVSIDPLLILWSIANTSHVYDAFKNNKQFAVHILAKDQENLANLFASKTLQKDRFKQIDWTKDPSPTLKDVSTVMHCEVHELVEAGDHTIIIGKVISIEGDHTYPLAYHNRKIASFPKSFHD